MDYKFYETDSNGVIPAGAQALTINDLELPADGAKWYVAVPNLIDSNNYKFDKADPKSRPAVGVSYALPARRGYRAWHYLPRLIPTDEYTTVVDVWKDGDESTTVTFTIKWKIEPALFDLSGVKWLDEGKLPYNGCHLSWIAVDIAVHIISRLRLASNV